MSTEEIQQLVHRVAMFATKYAMDGHPLAALTWIPPITATSDPRGGFCIMLHVPGGGSQTPPWNL